MYYIYIYISSQDGIPNGQVPTVYARNPAQPGMHETLQIMGSTANLNWCRISAINSY